MCLFAAAAVCIALIRGIRGEKQDRVDTNILRIMTNDTNQMQFFIRSIRMHSYIGISL